MLKAIVLIIAVSGALDASLNHARVMHAMASRVSHGAAAASDFGASLTGSSRQ